MKPLTSGITEARVVELASRLAEAALTDVLGAMLVPPAGMVHTYTFSAAEITVFTGEDGERVNATIRNVAIDDVASFRVVISRDVGNLTPDDRYRVLERAAELLMQRAARERDAGR